MIQLDCGDGYQQRVAVSRSLMLGAICPAFALSNCLMRVQATSSPPCPQLVSALTSDPHWKLVRKGTSAAFAQNNIRCGPKVSQSASATSKLISHL